MTDYTELANELRYCAIYELDKESGSIYAQHAGVMFKAADAIEELSKPMPIKTNADRLRSMTDEGLATWLNCMQSNAYHCGEFGRTNTAYPYNNKAWLDWLKSQVEPGEENK